MIIPLIVHERYEGLKPFINCSVKIPNFGFGFIEAFVDTGSPWTVLGPRDTNRITGRFLRKACSSRPRTIQFGGITVNGFPITNAIFRVRDNNNNLITIEPKIIYLLQPIGKDKKRVQATLQLPSIIGMNTLLENRLKFNFDPFNKTSSLEKV